MPVPALRWIWEDRNINGDLRRLRRVCLNWINAGAGVSASKRFLEYVSKKSGYDGEINDDVIHAAERILSELSTPVVGDRVWHPSSMMDGTVRMIGQSGGLVFADMDNGSIMRGKIGENFMLYKAEEFYKQMELDE